MAKAKWLIPIVCTGIVIFLAWLLVDTKKNQTRYIVFKTQRWEMAAGPITWVESPHHTGNGAMMRMGKETPSFTWALGPVRVIRVPEK